MRIKIFETLAAILVFTILIGTPFLIKAYGPWQKDQDIKVIHLTGISSSGIWTDEEVNSLNNSYKKFKKAKIIINVGEKVLLRLSSADVLHTFYIPELNIGPIEVAPGHVEEVMLKADSAGVYTYYCTTVCGECHFYMQGFITVLNKNSKKSKFRVSNKMNENCEIHVDNFEANSFLEFGKSLYERKGCITCHGKGGKGGIRNINYININVPELNTLADKLKIYKPKDVEKVIKLLEKGIDLQKLKFKPPFRNFNRFLAQYGSITKKINDGAYDLQMLNLKGPEPPLKMPSWEHHIKLNEQKAIIAYLLNEFPWDEFE